MNTNQRTVLDLGKVAYANFFWRSTRQGITHTVPLKPRFPTYDGLVIPKDIKRIQPECEGEMLNETMLEYAKRMHLVDNWIPVVKLQLTNSHTLEYTGEKAQSIWKAWNERQFKKKK